ncbi:protein of unknown function; putative membrane protein [Bradyrhizobium sp. ORS 285]|nr:hypothetical protein; putative membrane protein [Bradyrhizobium sp. ORS 285]SMX60750.1 protein of unknown function; putative membrane protein [Bradyrhizobium sp. ORS 285]
MFDSVATNSCPFVCGRVCSGAVNSMETIRPEKTDPIPLRPEPQRIGTIMVRFVGLLVIAMAVMVLIWSR